MHNRKVVTDNYMRMTVAPSQFQKYHELPSETQLKITENSRMSKT